MNGAIVRDLLLVATANRTLAGADAAGFWPEADCFYYTRSCRFVDENGVELAADPLAWFDLLRREGATGVRVSIAAAERLPGIDLPDRQLSAFANSGPVWLIEASGSHAPSVWRMFDEIFDDPPTDKPSGVLGVRMAAPAAPGAAPAALARAIAELDAALDPMIALAAREGMTDPFGALFQRARELLNDPSADWPHEGFYLDFERFGGFDATRMRTLAAVAHAWVFGGMGSWNDVGPDGPDVDRLFDALGATCAALANASTD